MTNLTSLRLTDLEAPNLPQPAESFSGRMMRKLRTIYDEVVMGWRCVYQLHRFNTYTVSEQGIPLVLYNSHGEVLTYTEALGWWWVEEHMLREDRELKKAMEEAFSASSDDKNERIRFDNSGKIAIGNPNAIKFGPNTIIASSPNHRTLALNEGIMTITHPEPLGTWEFFGIHVQSDHPPNLLQKLFSYLLLGAKWVPRYKTPRKKPETYLHLMLDLKAYEPKTSDPHLFFISSTQ